MQRTKNAGSGLPQSWSKLILTLLLNLSVDFDVVPQIKNN